MMSVMRHASKFSSFESEMHHHIYFSSTKERQDRGCPQKDPEGGKALTSNPIFQLDWRWTRELASKCSAGASGLTSRYVRTSRPTDACKQWNIPPPTQNCSKIDVVSSTLTRRQ